MAEIDNASVSNLPLSDSGPRLHGAAAMTLPVARF
jgi:hypothetical protein